MLFNTRAAMTCVKQVNSTLERVEGAASGEDLSGADRRAVLDDMQSLLLHGGAVSLILWPGKQGDQRRGEHLREALDLTEMNPLLNRSVRHAITHFDERLDRYFRNYPPGAFLPEFVGTSSHCGGLATHLFQAYYVDLRVFTVLGEQCDIQTLAAEMARIHQCLLECDRIGRLLKACNRREAR